MRRPLLVFGVSAILGLGASCIVPALELEGLACDEAHPCGPGRTCMANVCVDEGSTCSDPSIGQPCTVGLGECARSATWQCVDAAPSCPAQAGVGQDEVCDGLDNDCDGEADEHAVAEICGDGIDNDCSGAAEDVSGCLVTLVGQDGVPGMRDGDAVGSRFAGPEFVFFDAAGNLFVADTENHAIRKIAPDGTVTTVAGNGFCGYIDGPVATAQLCRPRDVEVGADGTVYFSDTDNHVIRKVVDGVVSTVAGTGEVGSTSGDARATARFVTPVGLLLLPNGDLLIADVSADRIRYFNASANTVSTWAGTTGGGYADGTRTTMDLNGPIDVVIDPTGTYVYVSEHVAQRIRRIPVNDVDPSTTIAGAIDGGGGNTDEVGTRARFDDPGQLFLDEINNVLYVADSGNDRIRKVPLDGTTPTSIVVGGGFQGVRNGTGTAARLNYPIGLAWREGSFYFTDVNHLVRKATWSGNPATVEVSDFSGGSVDTLVADGPSATARVWTPQGLSVAEDGSLYWVDDTFHLLRRRSPGGEVTTLVGSLSARAPGWDHGPFAASTLDQPSDTAFGPDGLLYLVEDGMDAIRVASVEAGILSLYSGPTSGASGYVDGPLPDARYADPDSLAFGKNAAGDDVLYVSDEDNDVIRAIAFPAGPVSTFAGASGGFAQPGPIAVDPSGVVWVADGALVRRVALDGTITTPLPTFNALVRDVAIDGANVLVLTERRLLSFEWAAPGVVTTLADYTRGYRDGDPSTASVYRLDEVSVTPDAYLLADGGANRIRRLWK